MASNTYSPQAALPPSFLCRSCGVNKPASLYSKSQIQKWYNKKRIDRYNEVTPQNVGLTCLAHDHHERELRCRGPCDRVMVVEQFSKRQRNDPNPWCTECTEWRTRFRGVDVPTAIPGVPLPPGAFDGGNRLFDGYEYENSDNAATGPSNGSSLITSVLSRLQGYNDVDEDEDASADAASITGNLAASLPDETSTNAVRSNAGSDRGSSTIHGMTELHQVTMASNNPGQSISQGQAQGSAANDIANSLGNYPHLRRLAPLVVANRRDGENQAVMQPAQATQFINVGGLTHRSEGEVHGRAITLNNREAWSSSRVTRETPKGGKRSRWYSGDNRKVFYESWSYLATNTQDRNNDAHDSDSSDEM